MTTGGAIDLVDLSDFAWARLRTRIDGLTDHEYFWEPVPNCWTVRDVGNGIFEPDAATPGAPGAPPPLTTIAWRLAHIASALIEERNARWLGVPDPADGSDAHGHLETAAGAIAWTDRAYQLWRTVLTSVGEDELWQPMGPTATPFDTHDRASFALHVLDEMIHHGAEVALMRDLYCAQVSSPA